VPLPGIAASWSQQQEAPLALRPTVRTVINPLGEQNYQVRRVRISVSSLLTGHRLIARHRTNQHRDQLSLSRSSQFSSSEVRINNRPIPSNLPFPSHITLAHHSSHSLTTPTTTSIQMTMREQVLKSQEGDNVLGLGPSIGVVSDAEGRVSPESTGSVSSFVLSNGDPLFVV